MTRGIKGCYVYSTDPETNAYLRTAAAGALPVTFEAEPVTGDLAPPPFRILSPEEAQATPNAVPKFDLEIAAGEFSEEQWLTGCDWIELPEHLVAKPGFFVARVVGESMNRRIPNGAWCLFRKDPAGSRDGKVVIVQSREIQDHETGGQYTVKIYRSEKREAADGWTHRSIRLEPDSLEPRFRPIIFDGEGESELKVVGEFVAIIG